MLAIDQMGIEASPVTPRGWHEFESTVTKNDQIRQMPSGRQDFYGWGGLEFVCAHPKQRDIAVSLHRPTAAKASSKIALRGLIQSGSWKAQVVDSPDAIDLVNAKSNVPAEWRLALRQTVAGPLNAKLVLRCTSGKGVLLLDAWRTGE
jgi:hypothetical protein